MLFLAPSPHGVSSVNCFREPQAKAVKSCQDHCCEHRDSVRRQGKRDGKTDAAFQDRSAKNRDDSRSGEDDCQNTEHSG